MTVQKGPKRRFAEFWLNLLAENGVVLSVGQGNVKSDTPFTPLKEFCREQGVLYQNIIDVLKQRKVPRDKTIESQFCPALGLTSKREIELAMLLAAQARMEPKYQGSMDPLIDQVEEEVGIIRGKRQAK